MQADMYELHRELEDTHWWFTARRTIVLAMLEEHLAEWPPRTGRLRIADVGCGAGGMLPHLAAFGDVVGIDPAPAAVEYSRRTGLDVRSGSLPDALPFDDTDAFDVITLLDVLEHVRDDEASLCTLHALLVPGGRLVITVPAFPMLWSSHDVVNEHFRRYRRPLLAERLRAAGFAVDRMSYCNSALFLPIAAVRILRRVSGRDAASEGDLGRVAEPLNSALHHLFAAERHLLRHFALPAGVSLIAVARRPSSQEVTS